MAGKDACDACPSFSYFDTFAKNHEYPLTDFGEHGRKVGNGCGSKINLQRLSGCPNTSLIVSHTNRKPISSVQRPHPTFGVILFEMWFKEKTHTKCVFVSHNNASNDPLWMPQLIHF